MDSRLADQGLAGGEILRWAISDPSSATIAFAIILLSLAGRGTNPRPLADITAEISIHRQRSLSASASNGLTSSSSKRSGMFREFGDRADRQGLSIFLPGDRRRPWRQRWRAARRLNAGSPRRWLAETGCDCHWQLRYPAGTDPVNRQARLPPRA